MLDTFRKVGSSLARSTQSFTLHLIGLALRGALARVVFAGALFGVGQGSTRSLVFGTRNSRLRRTSVERFRLRLVLGVSSGRLALGVSFWALGLDVQSGSSVLIRMQSRIRAVARSNGQVSSIAFNRVLSRIQLDVREIAMAGVS